MVGAGHEEMIPGSGCDLVWEESREDWKLISEFPAGLLTGRSGPGVGSGNGQEPRERGATAEAKSTGPGHGLTGGREQR